MRTVNSFQPDRYGAYDDLASEYYDSRRHPTCANFREASRALLFPWFRELVRHDSHVLEVGAGCSIFSEWLRDDQQSIGRFIATDLSPNMLRYSLALSPHAHLVGCDAQHLPFAANSFDVVVSSLGDPYNTILFWEEAARVLRTSAHVLFTTPSYEWAQQFRDGDAYAEFAMPGGRVLAVPSYVESPEAQRTMIEKAGLTLARRHDIQESQLRSTPRSPKLRPGPIVSGYIARKERPWPDG